MKGLLAELVKLLMGLPRRMAASSPERRASRAIARVEKDGGYLLKCGCLVAVRASDLRKMAANCGPEAVLEVGASVHGSHDGSECAGPTRTSFTRP